MYFNLPNHHNDYIFCSFVFQFSKETLDSYSCNNHHNVWMALVVMTSMVIQVRALQEEKLEEFFQLAIARFGQFYQFSIQFTK